jgi:murein DD-endopeptidase MepM/ murein hydrolase activator NlpD
MARRREVAVTRGPGRRGGRSSRLRLALVGTIAAAAVLAASAWAAGTLDLLGAAGGPGREPGGSGAVAGLAATPAARPPAGSSPARSPSAGSPSAGSPPSGSSPASSSPAAGSPGLTPPGGSSPRPTATGSPAPVRSPSASLRGSAPTRPSDLRLRRTVVPMHFPLPATARYRYTNDFLVRRAGRPYPYNHIVPVRGGRTQRAHDGVDIRVPLGTPVLSPFDGIVVDPATRWRPWSRARYGITVAVVSEEGTSRGYAALVAHLSRLSVSVGDRVKRGQVLGRTGRTGNAAGTPAHLHFELRAPFLLRARHGRIVRTVDAFDPYPSLVAADTRRNRPARTAP